MPNKKNIILITLTFILFFLVFPLSLRSNFNYSSTDVLKLEGNRTIPSGRKIPFVHNSIAGYFSEDLKSSWVIDVEDSITLLDDVYINNSRGDGSINLIGIDGEVQLSIKSDGYPFNIGNRLFIVDRDRKQLQEIEDGRVRWIKKFNYIITSIDSSLETVVIGFENGAFSLLNRDGEQFFEYEPGGSRISLVYSCELSYDGEYLSVVSGLDPQRFILFERKDMEYKPVFTLNLKDASKGRTNIFMTEDNRTIFLDSKYGYYMIDILNKTSTFIEESYTLKNARYMPEHQLYMLHTGAVNHNHLRLITRDGRVVLEKEFPGSDVSIISRDGNLYIVVDSSALKVDIKE